MFVLFIVCVGACVCVLCVSLLGVGACVFARVRACVCVCCFSVVSLLVCACA